MHKTVNVLDKLPKSVQPAAKQDLREIWQAPDRATAEAAISTFAEKYAAKYEKAVTCLTKDRGALLTFYDFPAEHWDHLRTSNPIESVFATVRHRTVRSKGALSQDTARLMVFKLVMAAAKTWRRLRGENQLPKVVQGVRFRNGVEVKETPAQTASLLRPMSLGLTDGKGVAYARWSGAAEAGGEDCVGDVGMEAVGIEVFPQPLTALGVLWMSRIG